MSALRQGRSISAGRPLAAGTCSSGHPGASVMPGMVPGRRHRQQPGIRDRLLAGSATTGRGGSAPTPRGRNVAEGLNGVNWACRREESVMCVFTYINAVSCASPGNCTAGGAHFDLPPTCGRLSSASETAGGVTQRNGRWSLAGQGARHRDPERGRQRRAPIRVMPSRRPVRGGGMRLASHVAAARSPESCAETEGRV